MKAWPARGDGRLVPTSDERVDGTIDGSESDYVYFGIIGLQSVVDFASYGTREFGFFERVTFSAHSNYLYRAVENSDLADALIRYAKYVTFELAIKNDAGIEASRALALRIISALRVKTMIDMLVPASLSVSWSKIGLCKKQTLFGEILEDMPSARSLDLPRLVEQDDFDWLWDRGELFQELLGDTRFSLAVESLCYCHLIRDFRMMTAALWAGIEAICGVKQELSYRIALIASSVVEPRGDRRLALYRKIRKLYDVRSAAVHGASVSDKDLEYHVLEVRILLAQMIMRCIEEKRVPEKEDFEIRLLT